MSKISVVYWSQSGNTAAMAEAVAKGVTDAGKEAEIVFVSSASIDELKSETAFALGCLQWVQRYLRRARWSRLSQSLRAAWQARQSVCSVHTDGAMASGCATGRANDSSRSYSSRRRGCYLQDAPDDDAKTACEELGKKLAAV